ncbi:hypothetical protein OOZ15_05410 [Galbibacter sp. EGI 63066]|uniref:hypothetical protein n=1 Tax=Galbibacter sp. EGI 63066 TaxID=2993559 RepID=UPI002248C0DD|nr:hypothetical protein [Galbibacter sp. EGI 63066]MCX2679374.1 hypothetical protein [Galbibacter sp. EGI 63066]
MTKNLLSIVLLLACCFSYGQTVTQDQILDKNQATIFLGTGGDSGPHGFVFDDDSGTPLLGMFYRTSSNQLRVEDYSNGSGIFSIDGDTKYSYFTDRLGIGTSTPTQKLDVNGNIAVSNSIVGPTLTIDLNKGNTNAPKKITSNHVGGYYTMEFQTYSSLYEKLQTRILMRGGGSDAIEFYDKDENQFIIFNGANGNVGIGVSNPGSKLVVDGKIRSEEVKVEVVNAPDYVFEEEYHLRTLKEVKEYIKKNKHLPEIDPGKEMERDGVDLGVMNMKLLKKIEELTLYQIQLQEKIESLTSSAIQQQEILQENKILKEEMSNLQTQNKQLYKKLEQIEQKLSIQNNKED